MRERLLKLRKGLSEAERQRLGTAISERVMEILAEDSLNPIGLYVSHDGEVPTEELFCRLQKMRRSVYFPKVLDGELRFGRSDSSEELSKGSFGIEEPVRGPFVSSDELQCVVLPGIVFDVQGGRIGSGYGYYDRSLASFKGLKVGLAYDFQVVDAVPHEIHDVSCDIVATEKHVIRRR